MSPARGRRRRRTATPRITAARVLALLEARPADAWLSPELAAQLGGGLAAVPRVEAALRSLEADGRVRLEAVAPADRHFAPFVVAAIIRPDLPRREAEEAARRRVEHGAARWLREVLASHRCIG